MPAHWPCVTVIHQSLTLDALYAAYDTRKRGPLERLDSTMHLTDYQGSVIEEDRRLSMFGWNIETISLLLEPMVLTK